MADEAVIRRFLKHVAPPLPCGCRLWTGARWGGAKGGGGDYGNFRIMDKDGRPRNESAHRFAYRVFNGPIPPGQIVRHSCDTPHCVEKTHLLLGTHKDNTTDMIKRGRARFGKAPCGDASPLIKITDAQVAAIRQDNRSQRAIARDYGISQPLVSYIKRGINRAA